MQSELATTNLLLGIMAAVSLLEGLIIIGMGVVAYMAYKKATTLIDDWMVLAHAVESRHMTPAMMRVNAILDDVKSVTTKVKDETERVDDAIHSTIDRIDETAVRMRSNVRAKTGAVVGVLRGIRMALEDMFRSAVRT